MTPDDPDAPRETPKASSGEPEAFEGGEASTGPSVECGEQGIRTLGTVTGTLDFESSAFDHSASSPPPLVANGEGASTPKSRDAPDTPPFEAIDEAFMRLALEEADRAEAEGEVPVGCVIVHAGEVIARAHNLREQTQDPTSHAEILAIRAAARRRGSWRLDGCEVYVTLEPCPMCAGALVNARVERVIFATPDPKAGATTTLYRIGEDPRLNHRFRQTTDVLRAEAAGKLRDFFGRIRRNQRARKLEREG